jgi:hypothetical protein
VYQVEGGSLAAALPTIAAQQLGKTASQSFERRSEDRRLNFTTLA